MREGAGHDKPAQGLCWLLLLLLLAGQGELLQLEDALGLDLWGDVCVDVRECDERSVFELECNPKQTHKHTA